MRPKRKGKHGKWRSRKDIQMTMLSRHTCALLLDNSFAKEMISACMVPLSSIYKGERNLGPKARGPQWLSIARKRGT